MWTPSGRAGFQRLDPFDDEQDKPAAQGPVESSRGLLLPKRTRFFSMLSNLKTLEMFAKVVTELNVPSFDRGQAVGADAGRSEMLNGVMRYP
jgi:hypothetical protein